MFLSSSMAEHSAVNRRVAGSSPAWGEFYRNSVLIGFKSVRGVIFLSSIVVCIGFHANCKVGSVTDS